MTFLNSSAFLFKRSPLTQLFFGAVLIGGLSACGNGGGSEGEPDDGDGPSGDMAPSGEVCANEQRAGSLSLRLSDGNRTLLDGSISDGVKPGGVNTELAADGACKLFGPRTLFCATPCASGTTCAGDGVCVRTPIIQSAGTIAIEGLLTPVEATANGITGSYTKTILDPYPAFAPGAAIELSATGDVIAAFKLHGWGVPPLVTSLTTVNVSSGSGVPLTWDTAGVNPEQSEVFIWFSVDVHGSTTRWIECTVPDSGSFEIPETLVTELVDLGLSGFPRMSMKRRSADSTQISTGDCLDFEVGSEVDIQLTVDGLISCNGDTECPTGQTCNELACE